MCWYLITDACQLLAEDILGTGWDPFALELCTLRDPGYRHRILLLVLLVLIVAS